MNLVIYHKNCPDGAMCAYLASLCFQDDAEYVAAAYGSNDPLPDVKDKNVYILDFSYPRAMLVSMSTEAKSLLVLDHHKTAEENCLGLPFCRFDMSKCGATLTSKYFGVSHPLLGYIEDRDLWKWELPHSEAVSMALEARGIRYNFKVIGELPEISELISEGEVLLKWQKQPVNKLVKSSVLLPSKARILNTGTLVSEVGSGIMGLGDCDFAILWYFDHLIGKVKVSLRSNNKRDVSMIAKQFGGGGHPNAAGCTIDDIGLLVRVC